MASNIQAIQEKIRPVLKRHGVVRAALFGSIVRGEETADSDIDVLVELPEEASLLDLVGLKLELEKVLKKRVDVLTYNGIYHRLRDRILKEAVPI